MISNHLVQASSFYLSGQHLPPEQVTSPPLLAESSQRILTIKEFKSVYTISYIAQFREKFEALDNRYGLIKFFFNHPINQLNLFDRQIIHFLNAGIELAHSDSFEKSIPDDDLIFHQTHKNFIYYLRYFSEWQVTEEFNRPSYLNVINFAQEMCYWMYSSPRLWDSMIQFIEETVGISLVIDEQLISSNLKENFKSVGESFYLQCNQVTLPKTKKLNIDLHASGDFPSVLFEMKSKAWVIRTPTVGMFILDSDNALSEVGVAADFTSYLSHLAQGESHLYINLMDRNLENEEDLCEVIEKLEEEFKENFQIVTLDKNSAFYYQENEYASMDCALDFKSNFNQALFHTYFSFFYWSKSLDLNAWEEECDQIMNTVHETYFSNQSKLIKSERCAFIEIVYLKIIECLTEKFQTTRVNLSCRYCADRGGTALALLYLYELLQSHQTLSPEQIKKVYSLALGPSLVAYHRATQKYRIDRFLEAAQFLIDPPTLEFQTFWNNKSNPFFLNPEDRIKIPSLIHHK
jgi:hypothetical protein